jgi:branched-subunit amino acid aminotransferase/4-amino-4-deoxychorismate lyase
MVDGVVADWNLHYERLKKGIEFVYGPFSDTPEWGSLFKSMCEDKFQYLYGNNVVRLTVYREQARGLINTSILSIDDLKIHVSASVFEEARIEGKGLKLRTCPFNMRPYWWPDFLKCGYYLETILSQKRYMKPGDDDVLFLSSDDTVLESSVANIFVVRNNNIYTAPTGPNVLNGIMRSKVLAVATEYFDQVAETETNMEQLLKADGVFGSNSVRGLFLVDRIDDHEINYSEDFREKFRRLKNRVLI